MTDVVRVLDTGALLAYATQKSTVVPATLIAAAEHCLKIAVGPPH